MGIGQLQACPRSSSSPKGPKEPLKAAGSVAVVGAATGAWPMAAGQSPPGARGDATPETTREATPGRVSRLALCWRRSLGRSLGLSAFRAALPWTAFCLIQIRNCYKNLRPASFIHAHLRDWDQILRCCTSLVSSHSFQSLLFCSTQLSPPQFGLAHPKPSRLSFAAFAR